MLMGVKIQRELFRDLRIEGCLVFGQSEDHAFAVFADHNVSTRMSAVREMDDFLKFLQTVDGLFEFGFLLLLFDDSHPGEFGEANGFLFLWCFLWVGFEEEL